MRLAVIIPIGPDHIEQAEQAAASVWNAWRTNSGPFRHLVVIRKRDLGKGRSETRNRGMDQAMELGADWLFLLDADDRMTPHAMSCIDLESPATFGAIMLNGQVALGDRWPVSRETLFAHGADGTLAMGCFVRADLGVRFDESLENGEDFDFYMRLPGFMKRPDPLVDIAYHAPAAHHKNSMARRKADWQNVCWQVVRGYAVREGRDDPGPTRPRSHKTRGRVSTSLLQAHRGK